MSPVELPPQRSRGGVLERSRGGVPASPGLRVLVVDDHRTFAEALAAGLCADVRFATVDVATSNSHARMLLNSHRYDLLLLDPSVDLATGLEFLRSVVSDRPTLAVVIVTALDDLEQVIDVLAHGVRAWVPKDTSLDGLLHAIDEAVAGRTWVPPTLLGPVLKELLARPPRTQPRHSFMNELTPRQAEVLQCLADGMSRAQIAEHLVLSPHTVRTHVQEVLRKAGVHSTLAALARAREVGYIHRDLPTRLGRPQSRPLAAGEPS